MPTPHAEESGYPMLRAIFRMFDYTHSPTDSVMPGSHSVERFVIENLHGIIKSHWKERKEDMCTDDKPSRKEQDTLELPHS